LSLGTKSVYKPEPTTSCAKILVIRTSRSRHGTAGHLHNCSSSPIPQSGSSELKLTRQALIRNTKTARQAEKAGAELMDGVRSGEDNLALTDNRQPFRPQLVTESMTTQIRPNDPVIIQGRQTDYIGEILRVHTQTIRSLAVAGPMVHRTLESTASLLQTSARKECYFSKKNWESERCLQLQHTTSIYANSSLPCATCVPSHSYPSAFPEQEVSHFEPQDATLLHGESPDFALIGTCFNAISCPTENAGPFSHPGSFQATGNDPLQIPINHLEIEESFGMIQPVAPAPQAGPHSPPLQAASNSTNEVDRTCPTLWDGSEFFNFDFEEANTDP
jgi:hypothetical protein